MPESINSIFDQETTKSEILTPITEINSPAPKGFVIYTQKYGETLSTLRPGYNKEILTLEGYYDIEVPQQILDICTEAKSLGGRALLVGGCVRDFVINTEHIDYYLETKDYDIEIYGLSAEVVRHILTLKHGKIREEGAAYTVLKVPIVGLDEPLETSLPRRDSKTGKGHKGFTVVGDPSMSIAEATLRRDLTINSLAYDPLSKTLYDPQGGIEDIKNKVIRVTNTATFQEDPPRVLRIMQFANRFEFTVEETTKDLCSEMVHNGTMEEMPSERVTEELKKLFLKGNKPSIGLEFAREIGLIEKYWPELFALVGVEQDAEWHPEGDTWRHTLQGVDAAVAISNREKLSDEDRLVLVLSVLCHDLGKPATTEFKDGKWRAHGHEEAGVEPTKKFLARFNFSDDDVKDKVIALVPEHLAPITFWENHNNGSDMTKGVNRLASRLAKAGTNIYMLTLLSEADKRGRNPNTASMLPLEREQIEGLAESQDWLLSMVAKLGVTESAPAPLLKGGFILKTLEAEGNPAAGGVWLGTVVSCVYNAQLDGQVTTEADALALGLVLLERLKAYVLEQSIQTGLPSEAIWTQLKRMPDPREVLV